MAGLDYQVYRWQGINKHGEIIKGRMGALYPEQVISQLSHQNIEVKEIDIQPNWITIANRKPPKIKDIVLFSRQLATMINAGVPLLRSLEIINTGIVNNYFQALIMALHDDINSGLTFTEALSKYPKQFNLLFCNLIKSGEISGTLGVVLSELADYLENIETLKGRVKKALFYPVVVLTITLGVAVLLLTFIVPQFEELFQSFGSELPGPTQAVLNLSKAIQDYWMIFIAVAIGVIVLYKTLKRKSERFCYQIDKFKLRMPIFGSLITKAILTRVMRTLGITLGAGIPLVTGLENVAQVAGNRVFTEGLLKVRNELISGEQLTYALSGNNIFPNMVVQMISVGEESGELEAMMYKISDYYDEQVKNMVDGLSTMIEPIMLVVLGVMIGTFVLTMYMPIFELGGAI